MERKKTKWRLMLKLSGVILGAIMVGEVALRCLGYGQFPLYNTDAEIGYIPKPNQAGNFAGKYAWSLNEHSMLDGGPWQPDRAHAVLLIGDSIVWGQVRMQPAEKLGACLQAAVGPAYKIWSASAGSWSNLNELAYLKRNGDVVNNLHGLVWIVIAGDFGPLTPWRNDYTRPRSQPWFLTAYLAGKVLAPHLTRIWPALEGETPLVQGQVLPESFRVLDEWLAQAPPDLVRHTLFAWYPDAKEFKRRQAATTRLFGQVKNLVEARGARFMDVAEEPSWQSSFYRDSIHPDADGNRVLAQILQAHLP